jgi:hypothetical protein
MNQPEVTFVLTSCGRVDLLQKTIESFEKFNTYPIKRGIITEDSCDPEVYEQVRNLFGDRYEIWANETKKGQIKSIVDAYATIDTPYIFHCEDDWEFIRSGFMEESIAILEHDPKIMQSWLEDRASANAAGNDKTQLFTFVDRTDIKGASYDKIKVAEGWEWGHFSFRPGLKRKSDYDLIGGYSNYTNEVDIDCSYRDLGFYCVIMAQPATIDLGANRRLPDPTRIWPNRRKHGKPTGLKRLIGHFKRLFKEGKW